MSQCSEPIERRRGGALQVWFPPVPGKEYLVAVDTAGGGADGDFAAVQVIELGRVCSARSCSSGCRGVELARVAAELAARVWTCLWPRGFDCCGAE